MSVYAKKGDVDFLAFRFEGAAVDYAYFNLASGTLGTIDSDYIEARITSVGGGWYRCEATRVLAASGNQAIMLSAQTDNDPTYAGAGTTAIYIQDAQVNLGLVAQDYLETTTSAVYGGVTDNLPRLDYSGGASCPSLLLEPQRTNLITQSEYFGTWTQADANVTANATRSPEGVQNAAEIEFTSSTAKIFDQFTNVASSMHIGSVWLKNKDIGSIRVRIEGGGPSILGRVDVNLANGTLSNAVGDFTPTIEAYEDGWYRVAVGDTSSATIASPSFNFDYLSSTGSFYAWGAQVEAGSYLTSYIPTYGSSETRVDEYFFNTTTNLQTQGILGSTWTFLYDQTFVDVARDAASSLFLLDNGIGGDGLTNVRISLNSSGTFRLQDSDGTQLSTNGNKILCRYDGSTIAWFIDGSLLNSHSVTDADFANLDQYNPSQNNKKKVILNQLLIFPTALTDAECIALTTI